MALYLRLLKYLKPYWPKLVFAMIFMALVASTNGLTAYIVKPVLDNIFFEKNALMLNVIPFGVILLYLLKGIFDYFQAYLMGFVGQKVITDLRDEIFNALQKQPLMYFDKTPTGTIISRIINDVTLVQSAVSDAFTAILKDIFTIIGLVCVVFYRDWKLATIAFIVLPFATYPIVSFGRRLRRISTRTQKEMAKLTNFLHETITGQRIVKAFCMEDYESRRFKDENETLFRIILKRYKIRALSSPIMEVLGGIAIAVIIWYGGSEVISGKSTPGNFFSFTAALLMLYEPIKRLNRENHNIQQGLAASQRVFEIIDREPEIKENEHAINLENVKGIIEFKDVYFKYEEKMVLKNINLKIDQNEVLAIVGESGVGKTTLANLIPRFYDVAKGSIEIDNIDIRNITLNSLRKNIALVTQDVILFNDTIKANICYGESQDMERMEEAAAMAYANDFISKLPKQYDTIVGEKGIRLSGGQKQRIAIARALYKNTPILILDEATSSLDVASEVEVQKAFDNLMKGRTTIVIAHRLSTVMNANRIIVLDGGTIVQTGSHAELIETDGHYKRLYELQFRDAPEKKVIKMSKKVKNA
ncbi:MAG TPA: lipid A export permease/ATP-binding protein MsbA [Syntrophorhabdaceae bacterium]|mgnify:FL=1|jgi:subfamily B ATP-binding cassette protein MsbA|nr:Lipid A export ATP-binding/permease protein MsbA [Syntrophorhabdaceae bacterium]HNQ63064.1 lipid A export permease/ATP-binding protein MsbA [Syntrophorhabdaceae bacterium]HNZ58846.1 lipid A export permease/ATP-binding protein MsbA [Syntrophorhabdaceae bacterium]HOB68459.1 lipid A export permease/ATP-binding protein MsbA [Syntrophorhabdaceae bacterium]HOG39959.1 lipid A export permease/ATP-binding protein MsbA [Syntrophorhabdaceae bacterium]